MPCSLNGTLYLLISVTFYSYNNTEEGKVDASILIFKTGNRHVPFLNNLSELF